MRNQKKPAGVVDTIRTGAIGISVVLILAGALFMVPGIQDYFTGGDNSWKIEPVDFSTLDSEPDTANAYLACPEYMCPYATADNTPPIYAVNATKLREMILGFVDTRPGVKLRSLDLNTLQFDFSVFTQGMRYPDVVTIRIHELSDEASTLALYSRSPLESNDKGRNKERAELWLRMIAPLKEEIAPLS